ncbi:hypothetical protein ACOSP7_003776 [Xanthoceras sorbifolium]
MPNQTPEGYLHSAALPMASSSVSSTSFRSRESASTIFILWSKKFDINYHHEFVHMTYVLIGCDGANSGVADVLELKPKKVFSSCALVRSIRGTTLSGTVPVNDNLVFWFVVQKWKPKVTSLSFTHLRYRAPWHLVLERFRKGTMTVAGDAMHVMGLFIGQGGSAAMEDTVVLAPCLARKMQANINMYHDMKGVEEGIDEYVKESIIILLKILEFSELISLILGSV